MVIDPTQHVARGGVIQRVQIERAKKVAALAPGSVEDRESSFRNHRHDCSDDLIGHLGTYAELVVADGEDEPLLALVSIPVDLRVKLRISSFFDPGATARRLDLSRMKPDLLSSLQISGCPFPVVGVTPAHHAEGEPAVHVGTLLKRSDRGGPW